MFTDYSMYFTIKLHHGGNLDESGKLYVDGKISYFDMCSSRSIYVVDRGFYLSDIQSMCRELGLEDGGYDLWFCIPEQPLENGLTPIENDDDIFTLLDMLVYSKLLVLYTTPRVLKNWNCEWDDFSFSQFVEDQKEERVGDMIDEAEKHKQIVENENENEVLDNENESSDDDEEESFEGDNSNIDSSESEAKMPPPKKKRRIPPPNPPYRTRKRGRYSMLRVSEFWHCCVYSLC